MIPLLDDNPRRGRALASTAFLLLHATACALGIFEVESPLAAFGYGSFDDPTGHLPGRLDGLLAVFCVMQLATLRVVADNVEDRLGVGRFIPAYLAIGALGWLVGGTAPPGAFLQAVVAAMLAAYTVFFPAQEVLFLNLATGRRGGRVPPATTSQGIVVLWLHQGAMQIVGALLGVPLLPVAAGVAAGLAIAFATERFAPRTEAVTVATAPSPVAASRRRARPPAAAAPAPPEARAPRRDPAATAARTRPARETSFLEPGGAAPPGAASARGTRSWAAIRLDDAPRRMDRLGRLVQAHTHEALIDVTRRVRHSRGLLAAGVPEAVARAIAEAASAIEIPSVAVPWPEPPLGEEERVLHLAWSDEGIAVRAQEGTVLDLPWRRILVAAGARIEGPAVRPAGGLGDGADLLEELGHGRATWGAAAPAPRVTARIDLLIEPAAEGIAPPGHLAVIEGVCTFLRDRPTKLAFRRFAAELIARRGAFASNAGLDRIVDRGRWGYLQFRDRRGHGEYLAWLAALAQRSRRAEPAGETAAAWLE